MMQALLVAEGLRVSRRRVREMLVRINPAAAAGDGEAQGLEEFIMCPVPTVSGTLMATCAS